MWALADPWVLLLLILPVFARRVVPEATSRGGAMRLPGSVAVALGIEGEATAAPVRALTVLAPAAIWALLVLALAGPERVATEEALPVSGRDIMLTLDLSGSMEREDFALDGQTVTRLAAVKDVAADFARARAGDRLGLVIFAEKSFVAAPLTHDVEAVVRTLEDATIGIAGRSTAISDGLGLALRRLERSPASGKVAILLSDGINNAGSVKPQAAAALAAALNIRVHTIALGPRDRSDGGDLRDVVDAETLRAVAELSGGRFFRVRSSADLAVVAAEIDVLEGSPTDAPPVEIRQGYWTWPAALALMLSLAQLVLVRRVA